VVQMIACFTGISRRARFLGCRKLVLHLRRPPD
jgi:hypothetical protein